MIKAVILDASTVTDGDVSLEPLTSLCDTEVYDYTTADEVAERIGSAEAVLTNKCRISREVFEKCPNLKYVGVFATGYNNVDIEAARERGAVVSNVPGYSTDSVAQHTFALILYHYSSVSRYAEYTGRGEWCFSKLFTHFGPPLYELRGSFAPRRHCNASLPAHPGHRKAYKRRHPRHDEAHGDFDKHLPRGSCGRARPAAGS